MRVGVWTVVGLLVAACGTKPLPTPLIVLTGAPTTGSALSSTAVSVSASVTSLGLLNGSVALGTAGGLLVSGTSGFEAAPVAAGGPASTGAVTALTMNGSDLYVAAAKGLFVGSGSTLALAPQSSAIPAGTAITALSAFTAGSSVQLWYVAGGQLFFVSGSTAKPVEVSGSVDQVVGMASDQAVVIADAELITIDLDRNVTFTVGGGLGRAFAAARDGSGTAWFATEAGLVSFTTGSIATLETLSATQPQAVCGVFASGNAVVAATAKALLSVSGTSATTTVGTVSVPASPSLQACPIAETSQGSVYFSVPSTSTLTDFSPASSGVVSFAKDVLPILNTYCNVCHVMNPNGNCYGSGAVNYFGDYSTAVMNAYLIPSAITSNTMPPSCSTPIPAQQAQTIITWCNEPSPAP